MNKEHYEHEYGPGGNARGGRIDREPKELWPRHHFYQDGRVNDLFVAYMRGYAFGKAVTA